MNCFNGLCLITLLFLATFNRTYAQPDQTEGDETVHVDYNIDRDEPSNDLNLVSDATESKASEYVDQGISDDLDVADEVSVPDQYYANVATQEGSEDVSIAQPAEEIPVELVAEQVEMNELDAMVEELIKSGAVEDDLATLETQPKWKLLLTQIGAYALSIGVTCKQLVMNLYTNMKDKVTTYWSGQGS
jgi:hypothetical protein